MRFQANPSHRVSGELRAPGDKSISHRSIMLGSLANGVTEVSGFLQGEDSLATLAAFRAMGVEISDPVEGALTIRGVGLHGLSAPTAPMYVGNSGTSIRLLAGILAGQSFDSELRGDESLSRRPMGRIAAPLSLMGAAVDMDEGGTPPLRIKGNRKLVGIEYAMPMASAQVKSSVLLAGLYADGETAVIEPAPTRDHTERMLQGFGYSVATENSRVSLRGGGELQGHTIEVPADISSAAFFLVAASIAEQADLLLTHVGMNPTRTGVINILRLMGADIELHNERVAGGEPVADIRVRSTQLKGIDIPEDQVPLAIDEFPSLFIAAACARGTTRLTGAQELRVKESDRIQVMADGLSALGVSNRSTEDGIEIIGKPEGSAFLAGQVHSHGDHRIAMSFAIASLKASGPIAIEDCENVATSFPGFVELANSVGLAIETVPAENA